MKAVRVFKVENPLAKLMRMPGGRSAIEALRAAEVRIDRKRDELAASLPKAAARLKALADGRGGDPARALDDIYGTANQIFALAGALRLRALSEAAYSLCDMVDAFRGTGDVSWAAIEVHTDAIRVISLVETPGAAEEAMAEGLRKVSARFTEKA